MTSSRLIDAIESAALRFEEAASKVSTTLTIHNRADIADWLLVCAAECRADILAENGGEFTDHPFGEGIRNAEEEELRDKFAGQALAGICAGLCSSSNHGDRAYDRVHFNSAAEDAYTIADAMIAARRASPLPADNGRAE